MNSLNSTAKVQLFNEAAKEDEKKYGIEDCCNRSLFRFRKMKL